ncbi:hypothetical protein [Mesorhizobium amorphae]|uniref:hypothetical protein n=1 Tax=Mesorhizobium amorphae TaxID=71433 RepID=UPI0021B4B187|nr:hypothetical protein [Mesorhizobium amorphae]
MTLAARSDRNTATIAELLDQEQERFRLTHPRSAEAWEEGQRHFLYGGPSHWMRRWAGGFPVYAAQAKARISAISTVRTMSTSRSAIPAVCAVMLRKR